MDSGQGNGSSKTLSSGPLQPFISFMDFQNDEQSRIESGSTTDGVKSDRTDNSPNSAASSTSGSNSTTADFFNPVIFTNSEDSDPKKSPQSEENAELHRRDVQHDVSITGLLSLEKIYGSSSSISQVSGVTQESLVPTLSQTQSPPVQIMERSGSYDPHRIPASVFTSKSSTPKEWSVNSNESLFSIQIGNSLARDQFAFSDALEFSKIPEESYKWKELCKSGELNRPNELHNSGVVKISDQAIVLGQTSPVTKHKGDKPENLDLGKNRVVLTDQVKDIVYRSINVEDKANQEGYSNKNDIRRSDQSSTFPVKRKPSKSLCLCSNCSRGCCCCKSPHWSCKCLCSPSSCCQCPSWSCQSFCCKCPSWSSCCSFKCHCPSCSWPFCCSWKNIKKILCCCSSKAWKDGRRRKRCSCSGCCPCCSSFSYSCC